MFQCTRRISLRIARFHRDTRELHARTGSWRGRWLPGPPRRWCRVAIGLEGGSSDLALRGDAEELLQVLEGDQPPPAGSTAGARSQPAYRADRNSAPQGRRLSGP